VPQCLEKEYSASFQHTSSRDGGGEDLREVEWSNIIPKHNGLQGKKWSGVGVK
jgi:hypothetical protein